MESTLIFQYVIIAVLVFAASYSIFRMLKKNFTKQKFSSKRSGCDRDCGCS